MGKSKVMNDVYEKKHGNFTLVNPPIPSMYGVFTYIYHKNQPFM